MIYAADMQHTSKAGVWVIIGPNGDGSDRVAGKIVANYGDSGTVTVGLWDWSNKLDSIYRQGRAGGGGYDKVAAVLSRFEFGGFELGANGREEWERELENHDYRIMRLL